MEITNTLPRVYLIDTENIGKKLLQELSKLGKDDRVIIFESDKSFRLSFRETTSIDNSKVSVIDAHNSAKNAMDFMIVTILGHLITVDKEKSYIIVSNDTGFDEVVNFWKSRGLCVRRHTDIGLEDESMDTQVYRTKELKLKELSKIYGTEENKHDTRKIMFNVGVLNEIIVLRSNESVVDIADIIYNNKDFMKCKEKILEQLRHNKNIKISKIFENWDEFFHIS